VWKELMRRGKAVERYAKASAATGQQTRDIRGRFVARASLGASKRNPWSYTAGRAPRDTGNLANSIATNLVIEGTEIVAIVSANTRYAYFVHEGTRYLRKRPFLKDALDIVMKQGGQSVA